MDDLVRLLEELCQRLVHLRYRTSVAVLLLRAGETRFLPHAADEVNDAVDRLAHVELLRATAVSALADELGVPDEELSLAGLIALADAATASRLRELQDRLRVALTELHELAGGGTVAATSELGSIRRSLGRWSGVTPASVGYGVASPVGPSRLDRSV